MSNEIYYIIIGIVGFIILFWFLFAMSLIAEKNKQIAELKDKVDHLETESLDLLRDLAEFKKSQDEEVLFTPEGGYLIVKKGEANAQAGSCASKATESL